MPAPGGRWLDIGFGNGALMTTAAEFGFHPVGLDLRENGVLLMRKFGYEAHAAPFEDYRPSELFDVISMADVLRHMAFPKRRCDTLELAARSGSCSSPCPMRIPFSEILNETASILIGRIEHYHNFGRRRLRAVAECDSSRSATA